MLCVDVGGSYPGRTGERVGRLPRSQLVDIYTTVSLQAEGNRSLSILITERSKTIFRDFKSQGVGQRECGLPC